MFDHQPQRLRETENGIGRFTLGIREIRDSEKRAINVIVPVNKQEFHRKRLILDSECMIPDDQGVTEEWILRVDGREYGPANIETLREWKAEGRVLPANEARRADAELWSLAAEIPGLFNIEALPTVSVPCLIHCTSSGQAPSPLRPRGFGEILTGTSRIYATGFLQFFSLTLLVVLPSVCAQLTAMWMQTGRASDADPRVLAAGGFAFLMFIFSMAMWPVYVAGIQIITTEIAAGRRIGFFAALNDAVRFWPRIAALCIFVYGVFFGLVWDWTALQHSLNELMARQDLPAVLQKLTEAQQAHSFDVLSFALGIVQKILQPLVGIAFVLLYFGSRKER